MTKYINTMTPEEIEAWARAPGHHFSGPKTTVLATVEATAARRASRERKRAEPKPPRTCVDCNTAVSQHALRCASCSLKARTATGRTPVVLVFLTHLVTPCRFCGEPSTTEDRCAHHDALWRRLKGLPPADLEALAERPSH
jgi:hypothetical protein